MSFWGKKDGKTQRFQGTSGKTSNSLPYVGQYGSKAQEVWLAEDAWGEL